MTYLISKLWDIKVQGQENIPSRGPYILASNHISHLDVFWILSILDKEQKAHLYTFAKKEHFESWTSFPFVTMAQAFPVDREGDFSIAIEKGLEILKRGDNLLIFPEGTRSKNGQLGSLTWGSLI